jgi:hypothetical protein
MNELQRQHYLSALGVDTYMPRWHLPFAPQSNVCELPVIPNDVQASANMETKVESVTSQIQLVQVIKTLSNEASPVNHLMGDILETKKAVKSVALTTNAADILAQLNTKPITIDAFSLSIWRPVEGVMIIDSRNTKLALPTELLLNNILRSVFSNQALKPQEEVLRWPMIENSFAKRTADDARTELQTWLSVQHELRPIRYLWLMGSNATTYLVQQQISVADTIFQSVTLADPIIQALNLPSLNELLQNPSTKKTLFSALHRYHSASL